MSTSERARVCVPSPGPGPLEVSVEVSIPRPPPGKPRPWMFRSRFFTKNGWPLAVISLIAVYRGVLYFPTGLNPKTPQGLEVVFGTTPLGYSIYCVLWILGGLLGVAAARQYDRRLAISVLTVLCGAWTFGYLLQFLHDWWGPESIQPALVYFGGLTYASFGAALFRYPAKG